MDKFLGLSEFTVRFAAGRSGARIAAAVKMQRLSAIAQRFITILSFGSC
ncbi:hypothetical protein [Paenibacillus sp. CF384]|nr:hypothetical protein [Paenibacillus sp. CF384]